MLHRLEQILLDIAVASVFVLGLLVAGNVVGRHVFGAEIPDSVVMVRDLMVVAILFPLARATAERRHVAVTFFTDFLSARAKARFTVFGWMVGTLAILPILYAAWRGFASAWGSGEFYQGDFDIPQWIGRFAFFLGMAVLWLRLAIQAVRDIAVLRRTGRIDGLDGVH